MPTETQYPITATPTEEEAALLSEDSKMCGLRLAFTYQGTSWEQPQATQEDSGPVGVREYHGWAQDVPYGILARLRHRGGSGDAEFFLLDADEELLDSIDYGDMYDAVQALIELVSEDGE